ncbi:hypothetical protein LIA77_07819 [Sarocladium implicatum]|nr:hypothetical protein LIA77_07819 [Sarocladium implicatum]
MAYTEVADPVNDCPTVATAAHFPNNHYSAIASAKAAVRAAEKAKKDAADRAAAEAAAKAKQDAEDLQATREKVTGLEDVVSNLNAKVKEQEAVLQAASSREGTARDAFDQDLRVKNQEIGELQSKVTGLEASLATSQSEFKEENKKRTDWEKWYYEEEKKRKDWEKWYYEEEKKRKDWEKWYYEEEKKRKDWEKWYYDEEKKRKDLEWELEQSEEVVVLRVVWGDRDLTGDGGVVSRVKEYVRNGWSISFGNDFFGCDPKWGTYKYGNVTFKRRGRRLMNLSAGEGQSMGTS